MTNVKSFIQNITYSMQRHGLVVGLFGLFLAMVFAGLWLSAPDATPSATTQGGGSSSTIPTVVSTITVPNTVIRNTSTTTTTTTTVESRPRVTGQSIRLVAVRIDNAPLARPQTGLQESPIIIENLVEGGLTRFTALFNTDQILPEVGPVRSLRWTDATLLPIFTDRVVSTGGRDFVQGAIEASGVKVVGFESGVLTRLGSNPPHDVFALVDAVPLGVETIPFAQGVVYPNSPTVEVVEVSFGGVETIEWRLRGTEFVRYADGQPHEVFPSSVGRSEPLARIAVLVISAIERDSGYVDIVGSYVPFFDLIGGGRAELHIAGVGSMTGTWRRAAVTDPFTILNVAGEAVAVPLEGLLVAIVPAS